MMSISVSYRFLGIILLLIFSHFSVPCQIIHQRDWANGNPKLLFSKIDSSMKYYKAEWFYENGNLQSVEKYSGCDSMKWDIADTIILGYYWRAFKCDVERVDFYDNKNQNIQGMAIVKDGQTSFRGTWYDNGQKKNEEIFDRGEKTNELRWYENGQLQLKKQYIVDSVYAKSHYVGGPIPPKSEKKKQLGSIPYGKWEYYSEDGKLIKEEYWKKGKLKKTIEHK